MIAPPFLFCLGIATKLVPCNDGPTHFPHPGGLERASPPTRGALSFAFPAVSSPHSSCPSRSLPRRGFLNGSQPPTLQMPLGGPPTDAQLTRDSFRAPTQFLQPKHRRLPPQARPSPPSGAYCTAMGLARFGSQSTLLSSKFPSSFSSAEGSLFSGASGLPWHARLASSPAQSLAVEPPRDRWSRCG